VRGESCYLIEAEDHYMAHVEEGLGTKNLVADAVQAQSGTCHYRAIGIDTVATIANDLITCGALPIAVAMHAAVGARTGSRTRTGPRSS
jgi:phosphoribosylformylglycinamidine cyclo-ligase